jgi:hypothetical protein
VREGEVRVRGDECGLVRILVELVERWENLIRRGRWI